MLNYLQNVIQTPFSLKDDLQ